MIALALAFTAKFVLLQYFDLMHAENFYDAGGHMRRGFYVTITGRSDPEVDTYFDIQPAFFWWTAVFVNILFGPQSSRTPMFFFPRKVVQHHYTVCLLADAYIRIQRARTIS
ncbi:MAG: hypothetical protein RMI56_04530 [Sulfolobales archaeon]|nr:hypothetical protein [Sulfolobales archaeon]